MNTTELISEIRRDWRGPQLQVLTTDTEALLARCDRVIEEELLPDVLDVQEEYLVMKERYELVSTENEYEIPDRAAASQVRSILLRDSASSGDMEEIQWIDSNNQGRFSADGTPEVAYLEGDKIVLRGKPEGVMDVRFYWEPSRLVPQDEKVQVTAVDTGTRTITTADTIPADWAVGTKLDIHSPDHAGAPRYWSLEIESLTATTITFTTEIAGETYGRQVVQTDDYVCLGRRAFIPQIPRILHGLVAKGVVLRLAESEGDREMLTLAQGRYDAMLRKVLRTLEDRVEQREVLINYNSRFRRGRSFGRRRRRFS